MMLCVFFGIPRRHPPAGPRPSWRGFAYFSVGLSLLYDAWAVEQYNPKASEAVNPAPQALLLAYGQMAGPSAPRMWKHYSPSVSAGLSRDTCLLFPKEPGSDGHMLHIHTCREWATSAHHA
jgi:hypothetical protein